MHRRASSLSFGLLLWAACLSAGCTPGSDGSGGIGSGGSGGRGTGGTVGVAGTGGAVATGGAAGTGNPAATGGVTATGGTNGTGGTTGTAGGSATGGATGSGGSGGRSTTGGASGTGGAQATGGRTATGGAPGTGGAQATGGQSATGGATVGTGGATGTGGITGTIYYVTPTGKATNDGKSFATALDFATALSRVVAGETILAKAGTYPVPYQAGAKNSIVFSKSGQAAKPILVASDGGQALFDFSFPEQMWVQDSFGFSVTGSYWTFRGIGITRAGYQGVYVTGQYNRFENCAFFDNRNTGLEINKGGAYTTVINCDAYRNYDPKKFGGMADGFGPKETQGPGNKFIGCRAWENSDDAYDAFESPETVTFENCWAFRNGIDVWNYGGYAGNGNGFKVGGNAVQANHKLTNCVAFENRVKGFDQNNNTGGLTIYNCTSYNNGMNFGLGGTLNSGQRHDLKNNISLGAAGTIANATDQNNSWSAGFAVSAADFASLDLALAIAARTADGALPQNDLFRLKAGSKLINAGINVGLPFKGTAPDLGAFESAY